MRAHAEHASFHSVEFSVALHQGNHWPESSCRAGDNGRPRCARGQVLGRVHAQLPGSANKVATLGANHWPHGGVFALVKQLWSSNMMVSQQSRTHCIAMQGQLGHGPACCLAHWALAPRPVPPHSLHALFCPRVRLVHGSFQERPRRRGRVRTARLCLRGPKNKRVSAVEHVRTHAQTRVPRPGLLVRWHGKFTRT